MSWEHLLAGWLAGIIVKNRERKKARQSQATDYFEYSPVTTASSITNTPKTATKERMFVNSKDKTIVRIYHPINMAVFDSPFNTGPDLPLFLLSEEEIEKLRYFYARVEANPHSYEARIALINHWLKIWKEAHNTTFIEPLQNELVYLIDYILPQNKQEKMYQHLAMLISSECYFFLGDFTNALKRLYQVLDWQDLYDNAEDKDGIDHNGLCHFHETVLANIINLYALVGLPEKADQVRRYCELVITEAQDSNLSVLAQYQHDESMRQHLNAAIGALRARDGFHAYYLLFHDAYSSNVFTESVTSIIRGQPIYDIQMRIVQSEDISYKEVYGLFDGKPGTYPSLSFLYCGDVINYRECIDRCKAAMAEI